MTVDDARDQEIQRIEALPFEDRAAAYVALADDLQRRLEARD